MAKKALRMRGGADGDAVAAQPKPDEMPVVTAETAEDAAAPHDTGAASSVPADASHTDSGAQTGEAAAAAAPAPAAAAAAATDSKPADASSAPATAATPSTPAQTGGRKHRKSAKRHHGRKHHKTAKRHHRGRKH
jgi:hypothetical protein